MFKNHLFRCSSLGHIMGEPKGKTNAEKYAEAVAKFEKLKAEYSEMKKEDAKGKPMKSAENKLLACQKANTAVMELEPLKDKIELSDSAKTHCMDIYISVTTGRRTDIQNRYIEKGLICEEDSITLYSRITKQVYIKNTIRLKNAFIQGEPDIFIGKAIHEAIDVKDIKTSWDIFTFGRTYIKDINNLYEWQLKGYMWLTGAKKSSLAYCLVNTPESLIEAEKKKLWYKLGQPNEFDENFDLACKELEKNMRYDDRPLNKKLLEYPVEYEEGDEERITAKVIAAREYLTQLHEELAW